MEPLIRYITGHVVRQPMLQLRPAAAARCCRLPTAQFRLAAAQPQPPAAEHAHTLLPTVERWLMELSTNCNAAFRGDDERTDTKFASLIFLSIDSTSKCLVNLKPNRP